MTADTSVAPADRTGSALAEARRARGWSQSVLAAEVSKAVGRDAQYSQTAISQWERGSANIPAEVEDVLHQVLPGWMASVSPRSAPAVESSTPLTGDGAHVSLATVPSSVLATKELCLEFIRWAMEPVSRKKVLQRIDALLGDEQRLPPNYARPRAFIKGVQEKIASKERGDVSRILQEEATREFTEELRIQEGFERWGREFLAKTKDSRPILIYAWSERVIQALWEASKDEDWAKRTDLLIAEGRVKSAPHLTTFGDGAVIWRKLDDTPYRSKKLILDIDAADLVLSGKVQRVLVGAQAGVEHGKDRHQIVATTGTRLLIKLAGLASPSVEVNILAESDKFRAKELSPDVTLNGNDVPARFLNHKGTNEAARLMVRKNEVFETESRFIVNEDWASPSQQERSAEEVA